MKFYKFINLKRQHMGASVVPEKGWQELQKSELREHISLLGECDPKGNLLTEVAANNFMSAPKKSEAREIPIDPELLSESEPDLQTFDEPKTIINEKLGTYTGTRTKKAATKKTGKAGK